MNKQLTEKPKTTEVLTAVEAASSWCCAARWNPTTASCTFTVHRSSLAALYLLPRQKPENWTCHEPKRTTASTLGQRNAICGSETWLKRACVTCKRQDATRRGPATSSHRLTSTPFKALKNIKWHILNQVPLTITSAFQDSLLWITRRTAKKAVWTWFCFRAGLF